MIPTKTDQSDRDPTDTFGERISFAVWAVAIGIPRASAEATLEAGRYIASVTSYWYANGTFRGADDNYASSFNGPPEFAEEWEIPDPELTSREDAFRELAEHGLATQRRYDARARAGIAVVIVTLGALQYFRSTMQLTPFSGPTTGSEILLAIGYVGAILSGWHHFKSYYGHEYGYFPPAVDLDRWFLQMRSYYQSNAEQSLTDAQRLSQRELQAAMRKHWRNIAQKAHEANLVRIESIKRSRNSLMVSLGTIILLLFTEMLG